MKDKIKILQFGKDDFRVSKNGRVVYLCSCLDMAKKEYIRLINVFTARLLFKRGDINYGQYKELARHKNIINYIK